MRRILRMAIQLAALTTAPLTFAMPIGFEDLTDGTSVSTQYAAQGVRFESATVLTSGISLNELEFPPHAGTNVAFDDGGPMVLRFSQPVRSFGAYFTHASRLELAAYDAADQLVGLLFSAFDNNLALSGDPGSAPNEWLGFSGSPGISTLTITGDTAGGSFVIDSVSFGVPVPSSLALTLLAGALLTGRRLRGKRLRAGLLAGVVGCASPGLTWAQAVAQPVVELTVLHATAAVQPRPITVSASITDPAGTLLSSSVNLLFLRPDGVAEIVGALNDAGNDGDAVAGDGIHSATFASNVHPFNRLGGDAGLVALRVSAAYRGVLRRVLSPLARLELIDPALPDDIRPSRIADAVWDDSLQIELIRNEVLFMAPPGTPASVLRQTAEQVGGQLVGLLPGDDVNTWQVEVDCSDAACLRPLVDRLASLPSTQGAVPNTVGRLAGIPKPDDTRFDEQYALSQVQALKAWTMTTGAHPHFPAGIPARRIAIVDSGVDALHPDLAGQLILGKNYAVDPPDLAPVDNVGHGTHVAGIAAAATGNAQGVSGMCWACRLVIVKVLDGAEDPLLRTTALQVAAGVRDAIQRHAQIINLSLQNFDRNEDIARQIDRAGRAGALVVAAAGNSGTDARSYPGAYEDTEVFRHGLIVRTYAPRVVTVGATDAARQRWPDSNHGGWVELYAPGAGILSTLPGGVYGTLSGTSMATPLVSAVAALASVGRSGLDPNAVRTALLGSRRDGGVVDPNGLAVLELDAFGAVFQGLASACARCPESPDVLLAGTTVLMGQGVAGNQARSVHGVSVPLRPAGPANRYVIDFRYDLLTQDAYVKAIDATTGYFDAFSISLSTAAYYNLRLGDPLTLRPDFTPLFVFGGSQRGVLVHTGWIQQSLPVAARRTNHLNAVLDTATAPDSDRSFWSGGTFEVLDITPQ